VDTGYVLSCVVQSISIGRRSVISIIVQFLNFKIFDVHPLFVHVVIVHPLRFCMMNNLL